MASIYNRVLPQKIFYCHLTYRGTSLQFRRARLSTFANQERIPRLPIPELDETCAKYLASVKPLATSKELKATEQKAKEFQDGLGPVLQQRLKDYDQAQTFSWLEQFWLDKAYLEWREPTLLNVNWWMQFYDTKAVKFSDTQSESFTEVQLRRAAMFIRGIMEFKSELDSGKLPPETMGKKQIPLCMNQYRFQFGVTRVPTKGKDVIVSEFPATGKEIMVMVQDQIYFVKAASDDGKLLSAKTIYDQLRKVTEDVSLLNDDQEEASIGVLTSEHRDKWSEAYEHLTKLGNENNFKRINDAVFSVSLDSFAAPEDIDASHHIFFHGNAKNRWFDKALQFIFTTNGRAGCNGEHSPSDAIIPTNIVASVLKREEAGELDFDATAAESSEIAIPARLKWKIDKKVEKYIEDAAKRASEDIEDMDSVLLHFKGYGSNAIKSHGISPDAFVQMALQLAYYRTYSEPCATYESASTRQFLHGRTETIRSCSTDSLSFTSSFDNEEFTDADRKELLAKAIKSHIKYAVDATNGKGVDRHFMGLRLMLQKGEKAGIFEDPLFARSCNFRLSTSNVSPGDYLYGGFGPVAADGYGINYAIGKEMLKFSISSRRRSSETCSRSFRKVLEGSLIDIMKLLLKKSD